MLSRLLSSGKLKIRTKMIITLIIVLITGISLFSYYNYTAARNSVRDNLFKMTLPLAEENVYRAIVNKAPSAALRYSGSYKNDRIILTDDDRLQIIQYIRTIKESYGCTVYVVDSSGIVRIHPNVKLTEQADIHKLKGIKDSADSILSSKTVRTFYEFDRNTEHVLLTVRYIPEFDRYIFAEIDENSILKSMRNYIALSILFAFIMTISIISLSVFIINHFQTMIDHMSVTDELTGANNRREFDLQFRNSIYNYNRNGTPFSLIIFDIDHLKNINDRMGHITGDSSIKTIATIARSVMRLTDVFVRWSGDEFIILTDGDEDSALSVAERIRKQVESSDFFRKHNEKETNKYDITISCGVSGFRKGDTLDTILARADAALNRAKSEGRNRICLG